MIQRVIASLTFTFSCAAFISGMRNETTSLHQKKIIGFNNTGSDCFMNASLQCLLNLSEFKSLITTAQPQGTCQPLVESLIKLIHRKSISYESINLDDFSYHTRNSIFDNKEGHEDAGEFLSELIKNITIAYAQSNNRISLKNLLTNTLSSARICSDCNTTTYALEGAQSILKLEIPQHTTTLKNCVAQFFASQELLSTEQVFCATCNQKQKNIKNFHLFQPAQHLMLQAKTWSNTTFIPFPLTNFSLNKYLYKSIKIDCTYNLTSIVMHQGSLEAGHFIAFINDNNQWYLCNDDKISKISNKKIQETAKDGFYLDSDTFEQFTPFIWFYSRKEVIEEEEEEEEDGDDDDDSVLIDFDKEDIEMENIIEQNEQKSTQLTIHKAAQTQGEKTYCTICDITFTRSRNLKDHLTTERHQKNVSKNGKFSCNVKTCTHKKKNNFESSKKLFIHLVNVHAKNTTKTTCPICEKVFKKRESLIIHLRTEAAYKEFKCEYCQQYYLTKGILNRHKKQH